MYVCMLGIHSSFDENILSQEERMASRGSRGGGSTGSKSRISLTGVSLKKKGQFLQILIHI
jgi:hypothetical protein